MGTACVQPVLLDRDGAILDAHVFGHSISFYIVMNVLMLRIELFFTFSATMRSQQLGSNNASDVFALQRSFLSISYLLAQSYPGQFYMNKILSISSGLDLSNRLASDFFSAERSVQNILHIKHFLAVKRCNRYIYIYLTLLSKFPKQTLGGTWLWFDQKGRDSFESCLSLSHRSLGTKGWFVKI